MKTAALACGTVLVLLAKLPFVCSQNASSPESTQLQQALELIESMPACGRDCLESAIADSPCSATDMSCSCSNSTIAAQVELCVSQSCTIKQQLTTKNTTETLCQQPIRDYTRDVSYVGMGGLILAWIAYTMRMLSRLPAFGGEVGWDDLILTFAMMEGTVFGIMSIFLAKLGLGRDIWTVPFDNITRIAFIYYWDEDIYLSALPIVKVSILMFYLRVFPDRRLRQWIWVTIGFCVAYAIAFVLISVFQCRPLSGAWMKWDGEHPAKCNNINAQVWAAAITNVVLDIIIISLPMPTLVQLEMNTRKKILAMLMFALGLFVTIISVIRLRVLAVFGRSTNFTQDYKEVGYWSSAELHLSIVCACMPAMRIFLMRIVPKSMGRDSRDRETQDTTLVEQSVRRPSWPEKKTSILVHTAARDEKDFIPLVDLDAAGGEETHQSHNHLAPTYARPTQWPLADERPVHRART